MDYDRAEMTAIEQTRPDLRDPEDLPSGPLYVFGYGSLLWRPGFSYIERRMARIHGYHRALRVWSFHHRGTEEQPGLVLGLDVGGSCVGCVFRVDTDARLEVARYLWAREMVTSVYCPRLVPVRVDDGSRITALTFVLDRSHVQYAGSISPETAASHVIHARGLSGCNPEYVRETLAGLDRLGVHDGTLRQVVRTLNHMEVD